MKKFLFILIAIIASFSTVVFAGPKIEVLHWWTSGGEAAALKVLKDDFAANGGEWLDMPVTGGGGDAANVTLTLIMTVHRIVQVNGVAVL